MSSKTKRWGMAILTVALVLVMGSALPLPAEHDTGGGATLTGLPDLAVISSQAGSTTGTPDRFIHEDEHDHDDD